MAELYSYKYTETILLADEESLAYMFNILSFRNVKDMWEIDNELMVKTFVVKIKFKNYMLIVFFLSGNNLG